MAVLSLALPPLRDRPDDVEPLVRRFLRELEPRRSVELTATAWARLRAHSWPGNVRELRNAVERALVLAGDAPLDVTHLQLGPSSAPPPAAGSAAATLDDLERRAILEALEAVGGNRKAAAERLGISLRTLQYRLKEYRGRGES